MFTWVNPRIIQIFLGQLQTVNGNCKVVGKPEHLPAILTYEREIVLFLAMLENSVLTMG